MKQCVKQLRHSVSSPLFIYLQSIAREIQKQPLFCQNKIVKSTLPPLRQTKMLIEEGTASICMNNTCIIYLGLQLAMHSEGT